jgi:hypothetical protein
MQIWRRGVMAGMLALASLGAGAAQPAAALDRNNPVVVGAGPRPVAPTFNGTELTVALDCTASSEKIDQDMAALMENPDSWFGQVRTMGEHSQLLMTWYGQQFVRAGRWNQAQADEFAAGLIERPEMAETADWMSEMMEGLLTDLTAAMEQAAEGNKIGACRTMERTFTRMRGAPDVLRRSWAAIDTIYTTEAHRLGVTLPE